MDKKHFVMRKYLKEISSLDQTAPPLEAMLRHHEASKGARKKNHNRTTDHLTNHNNHTNHNTNHTDYLTNHHINHLTSHHTNLLTSHHTNLLTSHHTNHNTNHTDYHSDYLTNHHTNHSDHRMDHHSDHRMDHLSDHRTDYQTSSYSPPPESYSPYSSFSPMGGQSPYSPYSPTGGHTEAERDRLGPPRAGPQYGDCIPAINTLKLETDPVGPGARGPPPPHPDPHYDSYPRAGGEGSNLVKAEEVVEDRYRLGGGREDAYDEAEFEFDPAAPYEGHDDMPLDLSIPKEEDAMPYGNMPFFNDYIAGSPSDYSMQEESCQNPWLKKIKTGTRSRVRSPKSWEFLLRLLMDHKSNPSMIKWEDERTGTFRLVQKDEIAKIWGMRSNKHKEGGLSYDNFARNLRYHYKTKMLVPVSEKHLVYRFSNEVMERRHSLVN